MTLKRSDVLVTEDTPPKYRTLQTMPVDEPANNFKKKPPQKGDLSEKLNVSMSMYSDLLDDE